MPDSRQSAEHLLLEVEHRLDDVDRALLADDPSQLEPASSGLRQLAIAFARVLEAALSAEAFDPSIRGRIESVAERLAQQRTQLARRSVMVERTLASIMRASRQPAATYSMPGERRGFGPASAAYGAS